MDIVNLQIREYSENSTFENNLLHIPDTDELVNPENGYIINACLLAHRCDDTKTSLHSLIRACHECVNRKLRKFVGLTRRL